MAFGMVFLSSRIREFVVKYFIKPRFHRGEKEVTIRADQVAKEMNLVGRIPAICSALRSEKMLELIRKQCGVVVEVEEIRREGVKRDSSTNLYVFRVAGGNAGSAGLSRQKVARSLDARTTEIHRDYWRYENEWFEETNVARKIVDWLRRDGWILLKFNEDKRQRGPDIIAIKEGRRMIVEVKGYPSDRYVRGEKKGQKKPTHPDPQARHWFAEALLSIIRRKHKEPNSIVAIGLPRKHIYEKLTEEVRDVLRKCSNLLFIFVYEDGKIRVLSC